MTPELWHNIVTFYVTWVTAGCHFGTNCIKVNYELAPRLEWLFIIIKLAWFFDKVWVKWQVANSKLNHRTSLKLYRVGHV